MGLLKMILKSWLMFPLHSRKQTEVDIDCYINNLKGTERNREEKRLIKYAFQCYSQNEEDGMIEEIFRRTGTGSGYFVEFGAGDGHISNTYYFLLKNWRGLWIEGSGKKCAKIQNTHKHCIEDKSLKVLHSLITAENIETLFRQNGVPEEFDLLSIDLDGNDYHVWDNIRSFRPRVVVIEYNAHLNASVEWVQKYNPTHVWAGNSYFGASLKALENLGAEKGYCLVGCDLTGSNAFFVRKDLMGDKFCGPYTSENHFEPPRYFLQRRQGHPVGFGPSAQGQKVCPV